MNKKWLHKIIGELNRNDGAAILAIVALVLMMTVMGGVFASIMSGWKTSAPNTVNSVRAAQMANSAATYAIQRANNDIDNGIDVICGNSSVKVPVVADDGNGGSSYYWIECPGSVGSPEASDDVTTGIDDDIVDDDLDDYLGCPNYVAADDDNGDNISDIYTIIATGKVEKGVTVLARRQVKVLVELIDSGGALVVATDRTNPVPGVAD